jgi:hypothetical protein
MQNSIFVIKPYQWSGLWVFDDPRLGLEKEAFVGGDDWTQRLRKDLFKRFNQI